MTALIIIGALLGLLFLGIPVAFVLASMGLAMLWIEGFNIIMVGQNLHGALDSFILLAIPLFLLMSNILLKGGVGRDLFEAVQSWVGHLPGGLGIATLISCGMFAAINGSSVATAATIGTVAIPEMTKRGYDRSFTFGLVAAGGTLGILIPPSIPLIVYGVITEQSIVSLFLAGIGPGVILLVLFCLHSLLFARFGSGYTPMPKASWEERRRATMRSLPTAGLAAIVIFGIYFGVFTPTEAAAIGFFCALLLTGLVLRTLTFEMLREAVEATVKTSVTILFIVIGAKIFGHAITLYRIPQDVSTFVVATFDEKTLFLLVVTAILLLIGLFLESLSMLLIMVPVLLPSLVNFGVDPIWFAIYFVILIEVALLTPPIGINLFVIQAIARSKLSEVVYGVLPFIVMMLFVVVLIFLMPDIVTYIPFKL